MDFFVLLAALHLNISILSYYHGYFLIAILCSFDLIFQDQIWISIRSVSALPTCDLEHPVLLTILFVVVKTSFTKSILFSFLADALLFLQDWDDPYVTRTHEGLLKWKYPEMNSVDFLFEVPVICVFNYIVFNGLVAMNIIFWCWGLFCHIWLLQLTNDNRQLVFLYERGKKKLMDGARIAFPGNHALQFLWCSQLISLFVSLKLVE